MQASNNINTTLKTSKSLDGKITITNYNPFTGIKPTDGYNWLYFKYDYANNTISIDHYINYDITLAGNVQFSHSILNNSDILSNFSPSIKVLLFNQSLRKFVNTVIIYSRSSL